MKTLAIISLIICGLGLILSIRMLYRNNKVFLFLGMCNEMCSQWGDRHISEMVEGKEKSAYEWFYAKLPTYYQLINSIKPLKLESFFTQDEINKIKS